LPNKAYLLLGAELEICAQPDHLQRRGADAVGACGARAACVQPAGRHRQKTVASAEEELE
jgi:hypothetical protein